MKCKKCKREPEVSHWKCTLAVSTYDESDNTALNFVLCEKCYKEFEQMVWWVWDREHIVGFDPSLRSEVAKCYGNCIEHTRPKEKTIKTKTGDITVVNDVSDDTIVK